MLYYNETRLESMTGETGDWRDNWMLSVHGLSKDNLPELVLFGVWVSGMKLRLAGVCAY